MCNLRELGDGMNLSRAGGSNTVNTDSVVLLSGGIDSATALAMVKQGDGEASSVFIDFGQPAASAEAKSAQRISAHFEVPHREIRLIDHHFEPGEIRARNAWLLHTALLLTENQGLVVIAIHAGTPYRDCSPAFIEVMRQSFDFHTDGTVGLSAPFLTHTKPEIFNLAVRLDVPIELTHSCEAGDVPCHKCLSCLDRDGLLTGA